MPDDGAGGITGVGTLDDLAATMPGSSRRRGRGSGPVVYVAKPR